MEKVNKTTYQRKIYFNLLPPEILFGFKTLNCKVLTEDDVYRPMYGLEIGFIFFTITFLHISWK